LSLPGKLVPYLYNLRPRYFVIGGLVFVPLTGNYIDSWQGAQSPIELVFSELKGEISNEREEIVVLSEVLPDEVNIGYHNVRYIAVKTLNSQIPKDFNDFVEKIEKSEDKYIEILLENDAKIVLDREKAKQATLSILKKYRIPSDGSKGTEN
jgi:transcriptional regulator of NAD metabolism